MSSGIFSKFSCCWPKTEMSRKMIVLNVCFFSESTMYNLRIEGATSARRQVQLEVTGIIQYSMSEVSTVFDLKVLMLLWAHIEYST